MANESFGLRQAGWYLDLGGGHRMDVEFNQMDTCWMAIGPAVNEISLWLNDSGQARFRVRLVRKPDGFVVSIDQGDVRPALWQESESPQIELKRSQESKTVSVLARAGTTKSAISLIDVPMPA